MIRIESTYLVKELPKDLEKYENSLIEQGYLIDSEDACRIRKKGDRFSFARKIIAIAGDKSYREHLEIPIAAEEYKKLLKIVKKSLTKRRYYFESKINGEIRVDVFEGKLKGLVLAEVIFTDETYLREFIPPVWFGREVTAEAWASNQFVAGKSYKEIKKLIESI
ncbi:MAG: hypothetical protein WC107_06385 [Patescibacteria group bacterium]